MVSRTDLENDLAAIMTKISGSDIGPVSPALSGKSLRDDLDIDSLAVVELADEIEARYGVAVPEEQLDGLRTFGDVVDCLGALV
jgi:acyl carrier protein